MFWSSSSSVAGGFPVCVLIFLLVFWNHEECVFNLFLPGSVLGLELAFCNRKCLMSNILCEGNRKLQGWALGVFLIFLAWHWSFFSAISYRFSFCLGHCSFFLCDLSEISFWVDIGVLSAIFLLDLLNFWGKKWWNCRYGDWALITGATDGIGKAFTGKLAKKKINLVIVGRSQPKLEELAKELHSKYGVEVGVLLL